MDYTELIREKLLRQIALEWIDRDKNQIPEMWYKAFMEPLRDRYIKEITQIKRQMNSNATFIIKEEPTEWTIKVTVKNKGKIEELPYMLPMLNAEIEGRILRMMENKLTK